ncbi:MAG: hypothetical protein PQJ59_10395 [Spirochaetales bacterium]|nr:hypothetical protein [Spirochaetales bacterium]
MSINRGFYCKSVKIDENTICIEGYTDLKNNDWGKRTLYLSPESIPPLLCVMENYENFMNQSASLMGKTFKNDFDEIDYTICGSDTQPIFSITNLKRRLINGRKVGGALDIPYQPFNKELVYENIGQVMDELKKYI